MMCRVLCFVAQERGEKKCGVAISEPSTARHRSFPHPIPLQSNHVRIVSAAQVYVRRANTLAWVDPRARTDCDPTRGCGGNMKGYEHVTTVHCDCDCDFD